MTRIILIRHGQTAWNKVERIRGQVDIPLDETGLAQAEATARRVANQWQPVAVYCSPLLRAVQTAQPIAQRLGLLVEPVAGFNDLNFGQWQGLSPQEVEQRWPDEARAWVEAPHTITFPGGESLDQVRERSMTALQQVIQRHREEELAIVGHTVLNRVLLCAVLGLDNSNYWRIGQETCAINTFKWRKGVFFIESINDTCHLHRTSMWPTPADDSKASGPRWERQEAPGPKATVYTDGACKPNPGPGGWAAILRYPGHERVLTGGEPNTTNNRMELQAAIAALEALGEPHQVELHTDSRYMQQGITKWLSNWIVRGWRRSDGKPVLNRDLWKRLYAAIQRHRVRWRWVRGHSGDPQNERVDGLAHQAIYGTGSARQPIDRSVENDRRE
jgi:ribonuclease HI